MGVHLIYFAGVSTFVRQVLSMDGYSFNGAASWEHEVSNASQLSNDYEWAIFALAAIE